MHHYFFDKLTFQSLNFNEVNVAIIFDHLCGFQQSEFQQSEFQQSEFQQSE